MGEPLAVGHIHPCKGVPAERHHRSSEASVADVMAAAKAERAQRCEFGQPVQPLIIEAASVQAQGA